MMSSHLVRAGVLLAILWFALPADAINISTICVDAGIIRHLQYDHHLPDGQSAYAFYPELQIGGSLVGRYADWRFYWGHWDDGIDEPFPIMDMVTYSHSAHVIGARVLFANELIPAGPFPIHMTLGLSHHFVDGTVVGGYDYAGGTGEDFSEEVTYAEVGGGLARISHRLSKRNGRDGTAC